MSDDISPNLVLEYCAEGQNEAATTTDLVTRAMDNLIFLAVIDRDLSAAPAGAVEGNRYLVSGTPVGGDDWEDHGDDIAYYDGTQWRFKTPQAGWTMYVVDEDGFFIYNGTTWVQYQGGTSGSKGAPPLQVHIAKPTTQYHRGTTIQNDNDLTFPVAASEKWSFIFHLMYLSPSGDDINLTLTGPTSPTVFRWGIIAHNLNEGTSTGGSEITVVSDGNPQVLILAGSIINSTNAGSVLLRWSKNSDSTPGTNAAMYLGSWLQAWRH